MFKKIIAIVLCLLLVFSFAACKKDKNDVSSNITSSDPTQDYDSDIWDEGSLTDEEKEELEELWNDLKENNNIEISGSSSNDSSSNESNSQGSSSSDSSSGSSSTGSSSTTNSNDTDNLSGEISTGDKGVIW